MDKILLINIYFIILNCLLCSKNVISVWTKFDLVRPRVGAWGSTGITPYVKISGVDINRFLTSNISTNALFGSSIVNIGDLDLDGVDDIAVGAYGENCKLGNTTVVEAGGIYVLFMNPDATVKFATHINSAENGGPLTNNADQFGFSIAALGDLNGDGFVDIAVGAPGLILSSVYVLFMNKNGSVDSHILVRGVVNGQVPPGSSSDNSQGYSANGPPVRYGSRFGTALAGLGDLDQDGIPDFAVSAVDGSAGFTTVYVLFMFRNGTVKSYSTINNNGKGGGPISLLPFTSFGSSLALINDINQDGIPDLAIGSKDYSEAGSLNYNAGAVFVCMMSRNGTIQSYHLISEYSGKTKDAEKYVIPNVYFDNCGKALTSIGDINQDEMRQRHPSIPANPTRPSIGDLVVGCPQPLSGNLPGRLFFQYLSVQGSLRGFTEIPAMTDAMVGPELHELDEFGFSLGSYYDVDKNGLREILTGAPGDDEAGLNTGAFYVLFPRRRRYHPPQFDMRAYICSIAIPTGLMFLLIVYGTIYFLWKYRRIPDQAEIIVLAANIEIPFKRKKYKKNENHVHCTEYTN